MNIHYAIGDIHGRLDLLRAARSLILQDAETNNYTNATIVYLGDYIDRGPQSAQVLEELITVPMKGFKEVFIRGNHENIMLDALDLSGRRPNHVAGWQGMWLENGGTTTLMSYGNNYDSSGGFARWSVDIQDALNPKYWDWDNIKESIPKRHIDFLLSLPYYYDDGEHFYVHAGVRADAPVDDEYKQGSNVYTWSRTVQHTDVYTALDQRTRILVHGHTPTYNNYAHTSDNRYNLDIGSVHCGRQVVGVFGEGLEEARMLYTDNLVRPLLDKSGVPC